MCVRGATQDEKCLGESDSNLDLFSIFSWGFCPLVRDLFLGVFIFSYIISEFYFFAIEICFYGIRVFCSFSMQPGLFYSSFPSSTSSGAALGEGVLHFLRQSQYSLWSVPKYFNSYHIGCLFHIFYFKILWVKTSSLT